MGREGCREAAPGQLDPVVSRAPGAARAGVLDPSLSHPELTVQAQGRSPRGSGQCQEGCGLGSSSGSVTGAPRPRISRCSQLPASRAAALSPRCLAGDTPAPLPRDPDQPQPQAGPSETCRDSLLP